MEYNTGLSKASRKAIADGLTVLLADTYALYLKTQNFHWNLKGADFFSLHLLFEKQYSKMAEAIDEIAERIRILDMMAIGSFGALKKNTTIKDEDKSLNIKDMIKELLEGHETLIRGARKLAELADKNVDFASMDLIGRMIGTHEKFAWMLRSSL
ncbi:MAG TPA: Dps family protein [Rhabdochlamydiaceae bacterium]|nr:Dps family protein [Rhabdochlamydiaceae bacterium]